MKLRTKVIPPPLGFEVTHQSQLVLMGSCFSDHIGDRLTRGGFEVVTNPLGTMFNAISIFKNIERAIDGEIITPSQLGRRNDGFYYHFDFHTSFNSKEADEVVNSINLGLDNLKEALIKSEVLFITLGSSIVYLHNDSSQVVANCHKEPAAAFTKKLMSIREQRTYCETIMVKLREYNPKIRVVFTVSPVRHTKEGMIENSRSKSICLELVHQLVDASSEREYFPSFEVMMDDLRDYRFYQDDMIHPSQVAVDYIWRLLIERMCSVNTREVIKHYEDLTTAREHRPMHHDPLQDVKHQAYIAKKKALIEALRKN